MSANASGTLFTQFTATPVPCGFARYAASVARRARSTGGMPAVTVCRPVMSASRSDKRIRRLPIEKNRWPSTVLVSGATVDGRRIRSIGAAPSLTMGRSRRRAPVRPLFSRFSYPAGAVPVVTLYQVGSLAVLPGTSAIPVGLPPPSNTSVLGGTLATTTLPSWAAPPQLPPWPPQLSRRNVGLVPPVVASST